MKLSTLAVLTVLLCIPYVWNAHDLVSCDFEADYKCEVIHSIGVIIPPASYVTVWFENDGD